MTKPTLEELKESIGIIKDSLKPSQKDLDFIHSRGEKLASVEELVFLELSDNTGEEKDLETHVKKCGRRFKVLSLLTLTNSEEIKNLSDSFKELKKTLVFVLIGAAIAIYTKDFTLPYIVKMVAALLAIL